ncbi:hypothetical protein SAY86_028179 [Trapa natans]|uniref:X8 domain-containing protein n=1 Tax=Trapa natans TaxID=22666 RepID=A0AAN7LU91_TRANT|nr:hypothetical protein SAY86_028179 [Trapa natans]
MSPIKIPSGSPSSQALSTPLIIMASKSPCHLFLLFHLLMGCSSGNIVAASSTSYHPHFLTNNGRTRNSAALRTRVDLSLDKSLVNSLISSDPSAIVAWLKTSVIHGKHITSITVRLDNDKSGTVELQNLQTALKKVGKIITSHGAKMLVAFPLPFLEKLTEKNARELFKGIEKSISTVIIETDINNYWDNNGDRLLPKDGLRVVLAIKGPAATSEISQLQVKMAEILKNMKEPSPAPPRRELSSSNHFKRVIHDTDFPVTPIPTVVTVPGSADPVTITPTNPTMTPVSPPPNSPAYPASSVTNPALTPVPVTNPVTTYPSSPGIPVINPTPDTVPTSNPPATPSASPTTSGQSWCIARAGVTETALQSALDYACGIGGADCSQIQMGASCYTPNTLQGHASYAFNSYYQKNPVATSCDFGGTATIVSTNPSTGSCIYPTSSQTSAPATTTTTTPTPTPTTASLIPPSTGAVPVPIPGMGTPPAMVNTGSPASGNPTNFGLTGTTPPGMTTSTSSSATSQPLVGCIIILISLILQGLHYTGQT